MEFVTSEEALAIVQAKAGDASAAAKALIRESSARWKAMEGNYRDDIAIVVFLPVLEGLGPRDSAPVAKQTPSSTPKGRRPSAVITEQSVGIELAPAPADVGGALGGGRRRGNSGAAHQASAVDGRQHDERLNRERTTLFSLFSKCFVYEY